MALIERLAYGAREGVRVSWYFGQKLLAARLSPSVPARPGLRERMPGTERILRDLGALLAEDLRNIEAGRYAAPPPPLDGPAARIAAARRFFEDLGEVNRRRRENARAEMREAAPPGGWPTYYLQNFHYQTDGWLSAESAALYDHQVEVLFGGGADAMRRQALVPLGDELARIGVRGRRLLDIACGTGRFLREVKHNFPRLAATGIDMSPYYLAEARRALAGWSGVTLAQGAAEGLPLPDAAFDLATAVYLFHELPPGLRPRVAAEIARVLRPGGLFVLVDSLQLGDVPDYDALLEHFPESLHEPYYEGYIRADLPALFGAAGLALEGTGRAYFSKIMTFRRR
jgi:ubiquinone/menaquinone biosynthesis C-methylase UbiE